jgi:hypothetical protein
MKNTVNTANKTFRQPKFGQVIKCRGGVWRFLGEHDGFWDLELIKQGANFAEIPVRVWVLPQLESNNIEILDEDSSLYPLPTTEQVREQKSFRPTIAAHRSKVIQFDRGTMDASTAASCAIDQKAWQFEPWRRIIESLPFPRLLIADDVGLGKTTEAAIILAELARRRRADRVMIVAPQHLCEKWQDELFNRFGLVFEVFNRETRERLSDRGVTNPWEVVERVIVSRDFVKRWENFKPLSHVEWDMVVIDECHHFVKDDSGFSTRLRDFAEKIALKSPGLILLSATPFTGSKEEFRSLIGLLDPKFSDENVKWNASNPYMIRRLKKDVRSAGEVFEDRSVSTLKISATDLSKAELNCFAAVHEVLEQQSQAAQSDETWRHLQIETLRKRLSSSWNAFYETCVGGEISKWFDQKVTEKIAALIVTGDSAKMKKVGAYLSDLHKKDRSKKVVIFTEAIASQNALQSYLINKCGYKAAEVRVIAGQTERADRLDIEDQFANSNSDLKVLIATDTISEGKDLQHSCHHLIHFELPWSLVKIEQRNGRIDRLGQKFPPTISNVVLDLDYTPDQRVLNRLSDRMNEAQKSLGSISPILETDQLRFSDLMKSEKNEKQDFNIDDIKKQYEELGIDIGGASPLAPTSLNHRDDSIERRTMFDLMVTQLGGGLEPNGKNPKEELLWLPDDQWPLPELLLNASGYPTQDRPWRVTFCPKHFLAYEKHLISGGEAKVPLQFMSPIHPVVQLIESRFRFHSAKKGYPIFSVKGAPARFTAVVEYSIRSPRGRVVTQRLEFVNIETQGMVDPTGFGDLVTGPRSPKLPGEENWKKLLKGLKNRMQSFESELDKQFIQRKSELVLEHNEISAEVSGLSQRLAWINELWTIDSRQSQIQILGLIVSEGQA